MYSVSGGEDEGGEVGVVGNQVQGPDSAEDRPHLHWLPSVVMPKR